MPALWPPLISLVLSPTNTVLSLENDVRIFDRLVRGNGFPLVRKMAERFLHARIENGPIQTVGEVVPAKDAERLLETHPVVFSDRQSKQLFDPITDKPEDFLYRPLRQPQLFQRKIDRGGDIPFRFDQCAVQIENQ